MATGQWPMIINVQSGLSAGNHSVVITVRDILGLTADTTLNYLLEEEEQARQNRMYNWYTIPIIEYDIVVVTYKCILAICGNICSNNPSLTIQY